MEESIQHVVHGMGTLWLLGMIAVLVYMLGKGADLLVAEAVTLSVRWHMPKVLIGATIVSLGTTLPEAAVSVFAAFQGQPSLALGNAVGSIICDTGLILGLATVISPPPLVRRIVNRQGWIQLGAAVLLVLACVPWQAPVSVFESGGLLPRAMGFVFLLLLVGYMWISVVWSREGRDEREPELPGEKTSQGGFGIFCKLLAGVFLVVGASRLLIPAVEETALRWHVPESIIGATLVAFGTSLPELVTALTAVRRGHGEIAVGNVVGADILNVLFVAGASAAVTSPGLQAPAFFFQMQFPAMIALLLIFRIGVMRSKDRLCRGVGWTLLAGYLVVTVLSYR